MELPIAKQSYLPSTDTLVRAIKRAAVILARTAAEETQLDGATVFVNARRPGVRMINLATDLNIPGGATADGVLAQVFDHFREASVPCHALRCAETQWPKPLADAAEQAGYQRAASTVFLLDKFKRPGSFRDDLQVIPGRAAYAELRRLHRRDAVARWNADDRLADDLADTHIDFYDESRLDSFLGRLAGQPAGVVNVLTLGNIGVITDVHTDHEHRRQGVARTLLTHAIEHCQRAAFEQVVLEAPEDCGIERALYESLGFKAVATFSAYERPDHV